MKVAAIIQARTTSSRLPGKVLRQVLGKTLLEHMILRVQESRMIDNIVIATTKNIQDNPVAKLAEALKVGLYRGSEHNVIERYYKAAEKFRIKYIMRLTGDCPLIDPDLLDELIIFFEQGCYDYACNCLEPTLPDGLDAEIFTFEALEEAYKYARLPSEIEHVTPYIRNNSGRFKIGSWKYENDLSVYRWTVDEPEDFILVRQIIESLYPDSKSFRLKEIINLLAKNPELIEINRKYTRNEGYQLSLKKDKKF